MAGGQRKANGQQKPAVAAEPKRVNQLIKSSEARIQAILPSHMKARRIVRMAMIEVARNPTLQKCTAESVILAVMDAARLGLDIGRQCHLIPYKGQAQMQPNYQGLCDLAYRTGSIKKITTACVYDGDQFVVTLGTSGMISHIPGTTSRQNHDKITHAYAAALLQGDAWEFEVMTREELEYVRAQSKSPDGPAWKNWLGEMYRKVPLKRLLKRLPSSPELYEAIAIDHAWQDGAPDDPEVQELIETGREIALAEADEAFELEPEETK